MAYTVDITSTHSLTYAKTRQQVFYKRYEMYHDNYRDQVITRLNEIYAKASLLRMDKQLDMTNNVFKAIVSKISKVYASGIIREFGDSKMEELYQTFPIDKYMKEANKYVNAFNDILLQVSWDTTNDKPRIIFRYPHKTRVLTDENEIPSEVEYYVESIDNVEKWAYWNADEHYYKIYKSNGDFTVEPIEGNKEMVNPYGVLPFVFMQNGLEMSHFLTCTQVLIWLRSRLIWRCTTPLKTI